VHTRRKRRENNGLGSSGVNGLLADTSSYYSCGTSDSCPIGIRVL